MRAICAGWLVFAILLGSGSQVLAGSDPAAIAELAAACAACHISSNSASETPQLTGQREGYIIRQLRAFARGDRKSPVMTALATQLSDADITEIAAFWAHQPVGHDQAEPDRNAAIKKSHMVFPKDFPRGFVRYLSTNNAEQTSVSRTYINGIGFEAAKANRPLPDGTVIVVANYAAKLGADGSPVADKDGSWLTDKVTSYTGMEARSGWGKDIPDLLRNANWNYGLFTADKAPRTEINQAVCLACHRPKESESFVFSWAAIRAQAGAK